MVDGTPSGPVLERLAIVAARAILGAGAVSITVVASGGQDPTGC